MNFVMNRWAYGTMAAVVGVVMAYAMSLRYDNPWIFYVGAPVAVVSSLALIVLTGRHGRTAPEQDQLPND